MDRCGWPAGLAMAIWVWRQGLVQGWERREKRGGVCGKEGLACIYLSVRAVQWPQQVIKARSFTQTEPSNPETKNTCT